MDGSKRAKEMREEELEQQRQNASIAGPVKVDPRDYQIGGDHYSKYKIQPIEYITKNKLDFSQGNVIKYVTRFKDKNGLEDLQKAQHYLDLLFLYYE
jgi:hypothetical protein